MRFFKKLSFVYYYSIIQIYGYLDRIWSQLIQVIRVLLYSFVSSIASSYTNRTAINISFLDLVWPKHIFSYSSILFTSSTIKSYTFLTHFLKTTWLSKDIFNTITSPNPCFIQTVRDIAMYSGTRCVTLKLGRVLSYAKPTLQM